MRELERALPDARARIGAFVDANSAVQALEHYRHVPPEARALMIDVEARAGATQRRRFLRAALLHALIQTLGGQRFLALPARVAACQLRHLARIAADADEQAPWLDLGHDLYQKEFGLATLRLYAAGAQLVDYRCGVARSFLLKEGWRKALPKLFAFIKLGGFRPYFQLHTHTFNLDAFNPRGWEECYRCCAELYALHPEVLGMFSSSWYFDPSLGAISPRLAYLRETPCAAGATLTCLQHGGAATANALAASPTRRKLHAQGRYTPALYLLLWGKDAQLAWEKAARASVPAQQAQGVAEAAHQA